MNKRQVITLWVIAIILGFAVAAVKLTQKDATQSATARAPGQTLFDKFPAAQVASVSIQGAEGSATLTRKDDKWVVAERDDYPANAGYVNDFLRTLGELKVTRRRDWHRRRSRCSCLAKRWRFHCLKHP